MLQDLLSEIRAGGSLETHVLAARLGSSPELVEAMLGHLERLGFIKSYAACTDGCDGCSLLDSCSHTASVHLWQSTTPE